MVHFVYVVVNVCFHRAVCRKHELTQFELEMAAQDLISKKQQREELATGVSVHSISCQLSKTELHIILLESGMRDFPASLNGFIPTQAHVMSQEEGKK